MKNNLDDYNLITKNLANEIKTCGKSKSQIANELGINPSTITYYLNGKAQPSLTMFRKLCEVLDCSADEILNLK